MVTSFYLLASGRSAPKFSLSNR